MKKQGNNNRCHFFTFFLLKHCSLFGAACILLSYVPSSPFSNSFSALVTYQRLHHHKPTTTTTRSMKRSASQQKITNHVVKTPRHVLITRSVQRKEDRERERLEKAQAMMATPLLRALPLVVGSGFLFKWECRAVALASKPCQAIVAEKHHEIPRHCQVEIKCDLSVRGGTEWPKWVRARGLQGVIPTPAFSRAIFQKLCDLKVDAETTERKKQKVRDALPKWGVDFFAVHMHIWDAGHRNDGGIYFSLNKCFKPGAFPGNILRGWNLRIDDDLVLWTWDAFHKWKKIYNWKPLWAWDWDYDYIRSLGAEEEDDDDDDDDEEEEVPGPGNINYYFQPVRQDLD